MTLIAKPSLVSGIWAARGDSIAPTTLKIARGWIVEIPPHQQMNWWMKRTDEFIAHVNQKGIPTWDTNTQYYNNLSYVTGPTNGLLYRAVQDSLGKNPESTQGFWEVAYMRRADAYTKAEIDGFRNTDRQYADTTFLAKNQNLSDVPNKPQARQNLDIFSKAENDSRFLRVTQNLNDLSNIPVARSNLDVFSKGESITRFLDISKNLADLPNKVSARSNLGLGNAAVANIGQSGGQVAAGDDPRIVNAVPNTRTVHAGYGMRGGGRLNQDVIVEMGTPSSISLTTGNAMWGDTHTHALNLDMSQFFPSRWENVTAARANSTLYWNMTGKMMFVAVTANYTSWQSDIYFYVNGDLVYIDGADHAEAQGRTGGMVMVPAGASYSVTCTTGVTRWMETR